MAKVKADASTAPAGAAPPATDKPAEPKKPGRNEKVAAFTLAGKATFSFDEPQMSTGEFESYNGGKGMHAYNVVRDQDKVKGKSGKTALKYLMHASGKSLLDIVNEQSKRGRPKAEDKTAVAADGTPVATAPVQPTGKTPDGKDPFDFMDAAKPGAAAPA